MQRTTYDDTGRVVEYGWHVYRASRYTFNLSLTNGPQ
jgi:DNA-binding GntR family transcriptional regulator